MAKQPSPRALSPEIPVVSYPTPNVNDLMVVQDVDTRLAGYVAASYGDLHPDQVTYPGLKLVYQTPLDQEQNHMWVRRVYAKDRADQDTYNYAIKYAGSDPNFPTYIRTYTLLRSDYRPLGRGSVDPLFPVAPNGNEVVLNTEEVERYKDDTKESELDSLYVKVTRVYITLPGPTIFGGQVDTRYGLPISVEKQTVPAGVGPSVTFDGTDVRSSDIDPVDTLQSTRMTSVIPLPEPQVWYGRRVVSELPTVLRSAELVGTEQVAFVPNYEDLPSTPLKARYTRTFSFGPPGENSVSAATLLSPQTYSLVVEYQSSRFTESLTTGTSANSSTQASSTASSQSSSSASSQSGASTSSQSGASASSQSGASASSQAGSSASTQSGSSASSQVSNTASSQAGVSSSSQSSSSSSSQSGASASSQSGSTSSSQSGSSASTQSGSSASAQAGSSSSSQAGASSSAQAGSSSSAQTGASTSAQAGASAGASSGATANSQNGGSGTSSSTVKTSWTHDGPGAVLSSDPVSSSIENTNGSTSSTSNGQGTNTGTNTSTSTSTSSGTGSSTSLGTSSSTSAGTNASTSQGTNSSTSTGTSLSTSTGKSLSTSSGLTLSASSGQSSSTSTGSSLSAMSGASLSSSSGKSSSASVGRSSSSSSGKSLSTSSGTSVSVSSGKSVSSSSGRSASSSASLSVSQSQGLNLSASVGLSSSNSHSRSRSTSKNFLTIQLPKCLRGEFNLSTEILVNGVATTVAAHIPATVPSDLPWNTWFEVGTRNSEHWKYGIWVTEKVEVYLERAVA